MGVKTASGAISKIEMVAQEAGDIENQSHSLRLKPPNCTYGTVIFKTAIMCLREFAHAYYNALYEGEHIYC